MNTKEMMLDLFCLAVLLPCISSFSLSSCVNEHPPTKTGYINTLQRVIQLKVETQTVSAAAGVELCTNVSKPILEAETYEFQDVTDRNIVVFSAYHETRVNAGGPAIRIIASGWQRAYREVGDLYCTLWYKDRKNGISVGPAEYLNIFPSTAHHEMWCAHFILCPLPQGVSDVPHVVSVTHAPCAPAINTLYVANRDVVQKKGKFAVCYPVLHNRFKTWTTLVEFFEFQRLLGAEQITIYSFSVSEDVSKTLEYFQRLGWVMVVPWPFPGYSCHYFFQRMAINECIYRHMHKYEYVAILDLDELFMPRLSLRWPELFEVIESPDYGAYMFQHAYFRRNTSVPQQGDGIYSTQSMITLSSFYRTHEVTPPGKIRCKTMYKADKVLKADVHFPYALVPGAEEYLVDPKEAIMHHYRITPFQSFVKYAEKYHFIKDKRASTFAKELQKRYRRHLRNIMKTLK